MPSKQWCPWGYLFHLKILERSCLPACVLQASCQAFHSGFTSMCPSITASWATISTSPSDMPRLCRLSAPHPCLSLGERRLHRRPHFTPNSSQHILSLLLADWFCLPVCDNSISLLVPHLGLGILSWHALNDRLLLPFYSFSVVQSLLVRHLNPFILSLAIPPLSSGGLVYSPRDTCSAFSLACSFPISGSQTGSLFMTLASLSLPKPFPPFSWLLHGVSTVLQYEVTLEASLC